MRANLRSLAIAGGVLAGLWASEPAFAQKPGGVLRIPMGTSPASMSIHEESTIAALGPMMGVFNNLVMFDQHVPQNSLGSIVRDLEVSFRLKRPQASFIALLASGWSPVYPCHVGPRDMRSHPIGTGPFKFVEFKPNESVKVVRNPDYWKPGRPYLDAIEYPMITNPATAVLTFAAGKL